jgi:hypothetical protein
VGGACLTGRPAAAPGGAEPASAPAPTTYERKSYAVDPVGLTRPRFDEAPPPAAVAPVEGYLRVTNLGTLLDVLA